MDIIGELKKDGIELSVSGEKFTFIFDGKVMTLKQDTIERLLYSTMVNQVKLLSNI